MNTSQINASELDNIIVGRVEPKIYAFTTQTVPNYLKVGDTYRPVNVRIGEWQSIFPNLKHVYTNSARIDDNTIFRDFSVHEYLEQVKHLHRLTPTDMPTLTYYSREFFENATVSDIDEAIDDIHTSAKNNDGRYSLYQVNHLPITYTYTRGKCLKPRDNQAQVISNFAKAIKAGRKNLLMFAVMRFGKSFTSMCCAKQMNAKLVLVVSAKADVKEEWKKTVESIGNFEGYVFADKQSLLSDSSFIRKSRKKGDKVVLFLTLQDLQGDKLKQSHKEVFALNWDLLLVDETHFGARAEHYGKVLQNKKDGKQEIKRQLKDVITLDELDNVVKELSTKVTIHLSGTPYRILMGSEFQKEDIIAFVQFSDIADAQNQWLAENRYSEDVNEWDNPYFGFPQMIRFAFKPNQASLERIKQLEATGATTSFSELFRPRSLSEKDSDHKSFVHEDVVLNFLQVIDGAKNDANVLGFLDNDRIKEGKLCRHIVMILPYCASCDAMEELIKSHKDCFRNLGYYEIINISGVTKNKAFDSTEKVKSHIAKCETDGKKTITLTVNRMLTGSTVPQWDTMLYLKQTSSPEEYDQAVFRLQNPFVHEYLDNDNKLVKFNMKPQTILVDFDPDRVFRLQERKSQIYNVNVDNNGNSRLRERIEKELKISPIIIVDHNKLREVSSSNILDAVRNYSETRSVTDEALDTPVDFSLLNIQEIKKIINALNPIDSKKGLSIRANDNGGNDNGDDVGSTTSDVSADNSSSSQSDNDESKGKNDEQSLLAKKFATYYAIILFFAFLTDDNISSLEDIIRVINKGKDNIRISKNLGLDKNLLTLIQRHSNGFILSKLDYKIQNTNSLIRDTTKSPLQKVELLLKKFDRMSDSEIVTPQKVAQEMVDILPDEALANGPILDIASKQGEFAIALLRRFGAKASTKIYSICTSRIAYEFTRKVYKLLSMPIDNIFSSFTSFDLLIKGNEHIQKLKDMNFNTIIGNPPYQEEGESTRKAPIYHLFYDVAFKLAPIVTLITPGRYLFKAGQTPMEWMERTLSDKHFKIVDYFQKSNEVFPTVDIKGGVAIGLRNTDQEFGPIGFFSEFSLLKTIVNKVYTHDSFCKGAFAELVSSQGIYRFSNYALENIPRITEVQGKGTAAKITSNAFENLHEIFVQSKDECDGDATQIIGRIKGSRETRWISTKYLQANDYLNTYNVFVPEANGTGAIGEVLSTPVIGVPVIGHTDTFLSIGKFASAEEASACLKYVKSKFARCMLGTLKATQHNPKDTWANVPLQNFTEGSDIDWSKSVAEIDAQLYAKYGLTDEEIAFIESMIKPM